MGNAILGRYRSHKPTGSPLQCVYRKWLGAEAIDRIALRAFTSAELAMIDTYLGTIRSRKTIPSTKSIADGVRRSVMRYSRPFDDQIEIRRIVDPFVIQLFDRIPVDKPKGGRRCHGIDSHRVRLRWN